MFYLPPPSPFGMNQDRRALDGVDLHAPNAALVISAPYGAGAFEIAQRTWERDVPDLRYPQIWAMTTADRRTEINTDCVVVQDCSGTKAQRMASRLLARAPRRVIIILRESPSPQLATMRTRLQQLHFSPRTLAEPQNAGSLLEAIFRDVHPRAEVCSEVEAERERERAATRCEMAQRQFASTSAGMSWELAAETSGLQAEPRWRDGTPLELPRNPSEVTDAFIDELAMTAGLDAGHVRAILTALAEQSGGLINTALIARLVGERQPTVHRRLEVLANAFGFIRVPTLPLPCEVRTIQAPRFFSIDAAFGLKLAGRRARGYRDLEALIAVRLHAWASADPSNREVCCWRTAGGSEVDFVVRSRGWVVPVEVKLNARDVESAIAQMSRFTALHGDSMLAGLVVVGEQASAPRRLPSRIELANWAQL